MNDLYRAACEIQDYLVQKQLPFCFIGGVAVQRWGQQRMTVDVDVCVFTGWDGSESIITDLLKKFEARMQGAEDFAITNRVLLLKLSNGIACDIIFGALDFEREMIDRASSFEPDEAVFLTTCSAEDLIIAKAFAGRDIDWMDVEGILARNRSRLDLSHVRRWIKEFAAVKEGSGLEERLEALIAKHSFHA